MRRTILTFTAGAVTAVAFGLALPPDAAAQRDAARTLEDRLTTQAARLRRQAEEIRTLDETVLAQADTLAAQAVTLAAQDAAITALTERVDGLDADLALPRAVLSEDEETGVTVLTAPGGLRIESGGALDLVADGAASLSGADVTVAAAQGTLELSGNTNAELRTGAVLALDASLVQVNGGGRPAAGIGDQVAGTILGPGSPTFLVP